MARRPHTSARGGPSVLEGRFHRALEGRPIGGVAPSAWAGGSVDGAAGSVPWRRGGEARGGGGGGEFPSAAASAELRGRVRG